MLNNYEEKKQARIERMRQRIARLEKFAEGKDLSMFGESRSGIPLGQPILVGHHSERRHRRHLERIERIVRAGYNAADKAAQLRSRLETIENGTQIQIDNPDAKSLIESKIARLTENVEFMKAVNKMIRATSKLEGDARLDKLVELFIASGLELPKGDLREWFGNLTKPGRFAGPGFASFELTNTNAEIRRLKGRLVELSRVSEGFESFSVGEVNVELKDGQIQIEFPDKPSETVRSGLKSLAFKWSRYSGRWVRKHTGSTCGERFKARIVEVIKDYE